MGKLLISCITVCRNDKNGLIKTFRSAVSQTEGLSEIIIIDGASSDGTKELFPTMQSECDDKGIRFIAVSEPDSGIYNAMNKGISLMSGEWAVFMNSGDLFASDTVIEEVFRVDHNKADVIYCDYYMDTNGRIAEKKTFPLDNIKKGPVTSHQALLTKSSLLKKRAYQEKYRICADYEWYLDLYLKNGIFEYAPVYFCIFDGTGVSMTAAVETFREVSSMRTEKGVGDPKFVTIAKLPLVWLYGIFLKLFIK